MAIVVRCECGNQFQTGDENAGRAARCPVCQRELIVPQRSQHPDSELADFPGDRPTQTSGKAIASLILGICSFVVCCIGGLPAIILGMMGLNDINNPKKRLTGKGLATTGIVLGCISTFLIVPLVLIALLLPAVQAAREAARRAQCTNNQKQIGLAMHNYNMEKGTLPPAAKYDADGKPLLSWRVLLLPYLDAQGLYDQFNLDEPWDSPHNKPLVAQMPPVFRCPSEPPAEGMTTYEVIVDPSAVFTGEPMGVSFADVTDEKGATFLVVEAKNPVPWTKPEELSLASPDPTLGAGSKHPGGFNATMVDGSVRFIRTLGNNASSPQDLRALATRNGREPVLAP